MSYTIQNSILPPNWYRNESLSFSISSVEKRVAEMGLTTGIQTTELAADLPDNRGKYLTSIIRDGERGRELADSSARPVRVQGRRKRAIH